MSGITLGIIGVVFLFVLLFSGVYVGLALGLVGGLGLVLLQGFARAAGYASTIVFSHTNTTAFLVLPLFIMLGNLVIETGVGPICYNSLSKILGRVPAGLGIASVAGATAFGSMIGTAGSTSQIFSMIACPEMRKHGYDKRFSYGMVTSAGLLGMLIPPSTLAVVYGTATGDSIGKLLFAGVGPGILLAVLYSVCAVVMVKRKPALAPMNPDHFSGKEKLRSLVDLWPILMVGGIILGGIYGGIFTPTEAGAWGCLALLIVGLILRTLTPAKVWNATEETVVLAAQIFLILIGGKLFSAFLTLSGLSQMCINWIVATFHSQNAVVFMVVILYLILGCFLDSNSIIMITVPVVYPVIKAFGIDTIWFGMVLILALHVGMLTPPLGMCAYAVKSSAPDDVSLEDIFIGLIPFLFMAILCTLIVILIPGIATWLPGKMVNG